jgi:hypothetical protein
MRLFLLAWIFVLVGCGSDEKPDSGYGANTPIPPTRTCDALCERLADCAVALCNEDTSSTKYEGLRSALKDSCELNCTDAAVQSELSAEEWTCIFTDTCREFADYDACMVDGSYTCD